MDLPSFLDPFHPQVSTDEGQGATPTGGDLFKCMDESSQNSAVTSAQSSDFDPWASGATTGNASTLQTDLQPTIEQTINHVTSHGFDDDFVQGIMTSPMEQTSLAAALSVHSIDPCLAGISSHFDSGDDDDEHVFKTVPGEIHFSKLCV